MELTIRGKLIADPTVEVVATLRDGEILGDEMVQAAFHALRRRLEGGATIFVVPGRVFTGPDALLTPEGFWAGCLDFMWPIIEMSGDVPIIPRTPDGATS